VLNVLGHKRKANQYYLRFHLTPVKMARIKITTNIGKDGAKQELLHTVGENVN
jgi:hypothetical protein